MSKQYNSLGFLIFLGFASGLPLALTNSTLQAWLAETHVSITTIGLFSLVGAPYTFKFLWSALIDRFCPLSLGKFRGWILLMQLALIGSLVFLGILNPETQIRWMALFSLLIAFFSATQDIAIDAYRTDVLVAKDRGLGSAIFIFGYRVALLISGGLALIVAQYIGWRDTYFLMAGLMLIGVMTNSVIPKLACVSEAKVSVFYTLFLGVREFLARPFAYYILAFVILYKLGSAFVLSLLSTFFLRDLQFSLAVVGSVYKIYGAIAIMLGLFFGGLLLRKMPLLWALFWFGVFQALTNLLFLGFILVGKNATLLALSVMIEQMASGMSTAAFLAFLMALCHRQFTAIQFAVLSALDSLGRVFVGPVAAATVTAFGWSGYFIVGVALALPALGMLLYLKNKINFNAEKIC